MRRGLTAFALVAFTVLVQTALVNRIPFPWGVGPNLVVLVLAVVALRTSSAVGALLGFAAGLAVDVLPPADSQIGRYALVLAVAGYLVGALRDTSWRSGLWPLGVVAATTVGVGLGHAFVGLAVGDPRVSAETILHDLPLSLLLTMIVAPFVVYPVNRLMRLFDRDEYASIGDVPWAGGRIRR
ncbi:rod shape-determining protein MreD [Marinactinospora thermotolerans]|uniref:Rod shape-determining protein MreD n=1 Tax=Marinactinospora thermotolerans DSM 45154 TaxID=1122192 RepID=A0A1T4SQ08_9ACTN|nr:rod shape-determining protein MreD [Marinactinospora thermotolerans]SKA29968.1 rod shape-determining protein MreD [Marinactinospora thermotolerans DSM 45154]